MQSPNPYLIHLLEYLYPYFEHKRYALLEGNAQFKRITNFGFSSVLCSVHGEGRNTAVRFFIGLRHDLVERVLAGLFGQEGYYHSGSHTILVDARNLGWTSMGIVQNLRDLGQEADLFIDFMDRKGFDFLNTYRRLAACDILFNDKTETSAVWCNHQYQRCFRGMAIAHLTKHPDLALLFNQHRTYLAQRGFGGEIIRKFDVNFAKVRQPSLN